jgi:hypothetical protein
MSIYVPSMRYKATSVQGTPRAQEFFPPRRIAGPSRHPRSAELGFGPCTSDRSADFQVCRVADFQIGGAQNCARAFWRLFAATLFPAIWVFPLCTLRFPLFPRPLSSILRPPLPAINHQPTTINYPRPWSRGPFSPPRPSAPTSAPSASKSGRPNTASLTHRPLPRKS